MSVKRSFAKKSLGYNKSMMDALSASPAPIAVSLLFGAVAGPGSLAVLDMVKPLEDDTHIAQETALAQYDQALTTLEKKRDVVSSKATQSQLVPDDLKNLIDSVVAENDVAKVNAAELQRDYKGGMEQFIRAAHGDERLNEQNVKDLLTDFADQHGAIDTVTSFSTPDFNDLQECRAKFNGQEYTVNECTHSINEPVNMFQAGAAFALFPWLLVAAGATQRKRFERWASESNKPRNNH